MHLWSLAFLIVTVDGFSRISEPNFRGYNFAKEITGRKLNGSVIREVTVDSELECQFECAEDIRCLSYNFGPTPNKKRFNCTLSKSDRFVGKENFTEDEDVIYRGIQSDCETNNAPCGDKGDCIPNYEGDSVTCNCTSSGYMGKPCEPRSCAQLLQDGTTSSGVYTINPDGGEPMKVLCDMTTNDGGWTVFQKRLDGSVDFFLGWESYKNGFGDLKGEFWLGNDNLHRLTSFDEVMLRVDMEDFEGNVRYVEYTTFKVADEEDKYRLLIEGYSGTGGDSLTHHNNTQFTTKDSDNDISSSGNCAIRYVGAWWFRNCHAAHLNGFYRRGPHPDIYAKGVNWLAFRGFKYSLKRTEMKTRPLLKK